MDEVVQGSVKADVLINTTAVGMHPNEDGTIAVPTTGFALGLTQM
jgi:shikimate 5-dehydrogenase